MEWYNETSTQAKQPRMSKCDKQLTEQPNKKEESSLQN